MKRAAKQTLTLPAVQLAERLIDVEIPQIGVADPYRIESEIDRAAMALTVPEPKGRRILAGPNLRRKLERLAPAVPHQARLQERRNHRALFAHITPLKFVRAPLPRQHLADGKTTVLSVLGVRDVGEADAAKFALRTPEHPRVGGVDLDQPPFEIDQGEASGPLIKCRLDGFL